MDMMEKTVIIFGLSDYSRLLAEALTEDGVHVAGFCLDEAYLETDTFHDLPVVSYESLAADEVREELSILNALGYRGMNALRKSLHKRLLRDGFRPLSYVSPRAMLSNVVLGEGNVILENAYLGPHVRLGDGNVVWPNVCIAHDSQIGDFNFFAPAAVVGGGCVLGNCNFAGVSSIFRSGVKVGDRVLVGAGAYLATDAEDDSVCVPPRSVFLDKKSSEMDL